MDDFYDVQCIDFKLKKKIIKESLSVAKKHHIDVLDLKKSVARQASSLSLDEIMKKFNNSCHFVFIKRNFFNEETLYEVGFSTMPNIMDNKTYYLFIYIDKSDAEKIIKNNSLKSLN